MRCVNMRVSIGQPTSAFRHLATYTSCMPLPTLSTRHFFYRSVKKKSALDPALYPWTTIHGQAHSGVQEDVCAEGLVYLPAELCICDCAILRANGEQAAGPLQLLSRWLVESGSWLPLARERLPLRPTVHPGDAGDWTNFLLELYCVAWPLHALEELGQAVRNPETHAMWLPPVIDAVGSNRNIDAMILQCSASLLLFMPPPGILRAIWAVYRDPAAAGPIATWLAPTVHCIRWVTAPDNTLPAIWQAAITVFNAWMEPEVINPVHISVEQRQPTDAIELHRSRPSVDEAITEDGGGFVFLDGHIVCC